MKTKVIDSDLHEVSHLYCETHGPPGTGFQAIWILLALNK